VLAHGFARVRCESCKDELLVAFSCKGRGVCPSCNAKRAQVTAVHLVEQVLPHVPYRQWTLSFPHRVRWVLLKDVGLLSDVLTLFLRAGASPAATEGTAAGPTGWAGCCRVIHPVLQLRLAGDSRLSSTCFFSFSAWAFSSIPPRSLGYQWSADHRSVRQT
jgi:hypothetical protein